MGETSDLRWMRRALRLARRGIGRTSPNPAVGAVVVRGGRELGAGWHRGAGLPHAEVEALTDLRRRGYRARGATLYVTLEPCSTEGRTPPCTKAILEAGLSRVVVGAVDPNPRHRGRGLRLLRRAGVQVDSGVLERECARLNEAFNHWIVEGTPWVTVKAAMTLDGRIADAAGRSKWITGPRARAKGQRLRLAADGIVVGVNTVMADDPQLTVRRGPPGKRWRRVVLDSRARTPLTARVITDAHVKQTLVVVTRAAPSARVKALRQRVEVWVAPSRHGRPDPRWLLRKLGDEGVTSLLVEGGGAVNASFLEQGLAHRVAFFYAPKILADRAARPAVAGRGARHWSEILGLTDVEWRQLGPDLYMTARVLRAGGKRQGT